MDSEDVGIGRVGVLALEGVTEGVAIGRIDPFVSVELHHPRRPDVRETGQQPAPIGCVVPALVRGSHRVREDAVHEGVSPKQVTRLVGAAIVERDDDVGEAFDALEPAREIGGSIACR